MLRTTLSFPSPPSSNTRSQSRSSVVKRHIPVAKPATKRKKLLDPDQVVEDGVIQSVIDEATAAVTCTICYLTVDGFDEHTILGTNGCHKCEHPICSRCLLKVRLGVVGIDAYFTVEYRSSLLDRSLICRMQLTIPSIPRRNGAADYLTKCHMCKTIFHDVIQIGRLSSAHLKWMDIYYRLKQLPPRRLKCKKSATSYHSTDWEKLQCGDGCVNSECDSCHDESRTCSLGFDRDGEIDWSSIVNCIKQYCPCPVLGCTHKAIPLGDMKKHAETYHNTQPFPNSLYTTTSTAENAAHSDESESDFVPSSETDQLETDETLGTIHTCTVCERSYYRFQLQLTSGGICITCRNRDVNMDVTLYSTIMNAFVVEGVFFCSYCQSVHERGSTVIDFTEGLAKDELTLCYLCVSSVAYMLSYLVEGGENNEAEFALWVSNGIRRKCFTELKKYVPLVHSE